MFLTRRQRYPKLFGCVAVCLLLNWLVLTLGIPLPNWQAKDRGRPFPCMDSVCGCHSAEKCWRSCCCHTNREKLAWAKRNGLTPPAFVVAAAKKEAKPKCSSTSSCCTKNQPQAAPAEEPSPDESGQWVLSSVRRCQGSGTATISSELATTLSRPETFPPAVPPAQWIELFDLTELTIDLSPASPPPQLG